MRILCTGGGGFVAGHLIKRLLDDGHQVKAVDIKPFPEWWQWHRGAENVCLDLRDSSGAYVAFITGAAGKGKKIQFNRVYHLAAEMGGMGFITTKDAEIIRDNTLININVIEAARRAKAARFLFSSSACVYPVERQEMITRGCSMEPPYEKFLDLPRAPLPLKEYHVYPASPQHSYGWEKLHAEHLCKYYQEAGWLETRVARFHNCYGAFGSWNDGREKAPAALCRKIAKAKLAAEHPCGCNLPFLGAVPIWGDGTAVRSFMHVDDCVEGLMRLMESDHHEPLNIGRDRAVSVSELADIIIDIAGMTGKIEKKYVDGPVGVQWRNSDNSKCKEVLGWEPTIPIEEGLVDTFEWVLEMVKGRSCEGNCQFPPEREMCRCQK